MSTLDSPIPLAEARRELLLKTLRQRGAVRASELSQEFGVTELTIRRDIMRLAEAGLLRRVHGGATRLAPDDADDDELAGEPQQPTGARAITGTIGMLVPSLDHYWPGVARGAETEARARGLRVTLRGSSYDVDDDLPQLRRLTESAGVDALVVAPNLNGPHAQMTIDWLTHSGVPVVLLERSATTSPYGEPMNSVVTDHALGAATAVKHLVGLGHRRVGLVVSRLSPTGKHLRRGWRDASALFGLVVGDTVDAMVPPAIAPEWDASIDAVIDATLSTGTTALLVNADPEAMRLVQRCEQRGIAVPADLSVVAYDDEVAGLFTPALTAVRPPRRSIGHAAVWLATAHLADPGLPTHRVVISPRLKVRESSAAPRSVGPA